MAEPIKITYRNGAYYVNRPNWAGGDVVMAEEYAALKAENERLMKTLADMEAKKISLQDDALPKWINRAEAAERALAERAGGVKVKALEWDRRSVDGLTEYADSLLGEYQVWAIGGTGYFYRQSFATGQPAGENIEAAKAAAQADYERRILSALEPAAAETDKPTLYETLLMDAGASPEGARRLQRGEPAWAAGAKAQIRETHASIYTRPAEQAVTDKMVGVANSAFLNALFNEDGSGRVMEHATILGVNFNVCMRAALKAAMEAGR